MITVLRLAQRKGENRIAVQREEDIRYSEVEKVNT